MQAVWIQSSLSQTYAVMSLYSDISLPKQILPRYLLGNRIRKLMYWVWPCQGRGSLLGFRCDCSVSSAAPGFSEGLALTPGKCGRKLWGWSRFHSDCGCTIDIHSEGDKGVYYTICHNTTQLSNAHWDIRSRSKSLLHINGSNLYIPLIHLMYAEFSRIATTSKTKEMVLFFSEILPRAIHHFR